MLYVQPIVVFCWCFVLYWPLETRSVKLIFTQWLFLYREFSIRKYTSETFLLFKYFLMMLSLIVMCRGVYSSVYVRYVLKNEVNMDTVSDVTVYQWSKVIYLLEIWPLNYLHNVLTLHILELKGNNKLTLMVFT